MDNEKPISRFAQRFVEQKLRQIEMHAYNGADWYHEFAQNFTDGVHELAAKAKRADLRKHILASARSTGNYTGEEERPSPVARSAEIQNDHGDANRVRKIVWVGRSVDTETGQLVHGVVGRTDAGDYKAGRVSVYEESGPAGHTSYSPEPLIWSKQAYPHKEQAIFAARQNVAKEVSAVRDVEEEAVGQSAAPEKNAAVKYGCQDTPSQEIKPPSRSR